MTQLHRIEKLIGLLAVGFGWALLNLQSTELLNDPSRCIHIGDRESNIYELFCKQ